MALFRRSPEPDRTALRTIAVDSCIAEVGVEESVVLSRLDGSVRRCNRHLAEILQRLDRFGTPAGHAERLAALGFEFSGAAEIEETLSELAGLGLLVDEKRFQTRLAETSEEPDGGGITTVAWITRNRPEALLRSVASYADRLGRRPERAVRLLAVDGTEDPERRNTLESGLRGIVSKHALQVEYAGLEEKRRYAALLEAPLRARGVESTVLDFALFDPCGMGYTTGANRNALLLGTMGERVLSVDDDTVYDPAALFEPEAELALSSAVEPTRIEFFPSREAVLARARRRGSLPGPRDPLAAHGALLGRSVSACVKAAGARGSVDLDGVDAALVTSLLRRTHRVAVTSSGNYGDSGMGHPLFVLGLQGEDREAVMRSEETYRTALASREIVRGVPCATITSSPLLMAMTVGLDNRTALPPFFPVMRNQDEIFRRILTACSPETLTGFVAEAVYHDPPDPRSFPPQPSWKIRFTVPRIVTTVIQDWQGGRGLAEGRDAFEDLGLTFLDVGELAPGPFEEYLRQAWHRGMSQYLLRMEALREHFHGQPDYWDRDVETLCERTRATLISDAAHIPSDVPGNLDRPAALGKAQDLLHRFGALLRAWPVILDAVRELRASGEGLGRRLA